MGRAMKWCIVQYMDAVPWVQLVPLLAAEHRHPLPPYQPTSHPPFSPISLEVSTTTTRRRHSSASSRAISRMAVVLPTPGRPAAGERGADGAGESWLQLCAGGDELNSLKAAERMHQLQSR